MIVSFFVPGVPAQQGNHRRNQYGATYETSKNHAPWRDSLVWHARQARPMAADDGIVFAGAVYLELEFVFPRLKSHYRTGIHSNELKPDAPYNKTSAPDLDKLCRSILDALVLAGIYRDDAQVSGIRAAKTYGERAGVSVIANTHE